MIAPTIQWSLKNRLFVIAGALLLLLWGAYETTRMPVDVFPDLTAPTVTIVTEAHGMAPKEVETLVTLPIESALNGAAGIRRVRSNTQVGISTVYAEFEWGTDIYQARQIVSEKLQTVRSALPPDISSPVLAPVASVMGEIMFIALKSERHDAMELKTTADRVLRRRLLAVPGVAEVIPNGGQTKQFQVLVKPQRLASYRIDLDEVTKALRTTNQNSSAGFYTEGGQEYLIQGLGRVRSTADIGNTLVAMRGGEPVLVRHLAEVKVAPVPMRGTAAHNNQQAVVLGIQKQPGANTLELTNQLDRVLADIQASLPEEMKIESRVFRQANFISVSIDNLLNALRDGAILVIAIVFIFLASGRATAITLMALPLSLLTAVLVLKAMGGTINTMTLGGLVIALGALVDDAIIVVENIVRRMRENLRRPAQQQIPTLQVVLKATREIQGSIVFATLIIMVVFLPLFFLSGVEGRLMQPLGLAYIIALAASLLVAITVTPVLCSLFLKHSRVVKTDHETRLVVWLKKGYTLVLDATIHRWRSIAFFSLLGLLGTATALALAGRSFLPDFNEGSLTVSAVTLPGTSLQQSSQLGQRVEQILLSHAEVVSTARRTGRAELDPHAMGINASEIEVSLKMKDRSKEAFLAALRKNFASLPGMNIVIGQPISHRIDHMLSGTRANIAVKIFGHDLYSLRRLAEQVKGIAEKVPGAVDVAAELQADIPFLTVAFKRDAIARYGLTVGEVAEAIETAFFGQTVSKVLQGDASFDLVVRYDTSVLDSFETLRSTLITTASGAQLPLHSLAEVRKDRGANSISRENVQRKIVVMVNVAERDLGSVVNEIRNAVAAQLELPSGYHIEYGGQFESAEQASRTLALLGAVVVVFVFLLLFVAFRSARDAFLVMLNLPLALMGGAAGMYLSDGILSVATLIGFIALFGIATRNGVILIAHIHNLVEHEHVRNAHEAVRRAAIERLAPILMTALATALALVPLALSAGQPGSEIQAPMAVVILSGLLSSTLLNMIVVPALCLRFGSIGRRVIAADAVPAVS
ncbi:MAG: efflux RND transporter permease subunit [gamma proteobacterium endosymbiont of Lamellibrachia anaximandri]|nr:efflux RND transporter permease subunit [gamma proteobacterium endosymbiont of Lamellibrachia anaximandri]MBL3534553.1 efflux RND transporter permease subunit [gamma proteobacterium endosymbiont of Lamellibrachia anaximandri]